MERPIQPNEIAVLQWLLDHAAMGDASGSEYRLDDLRVVPTACQCGCASLDFEIGGWGGARILADALVLYPEGKKAGLILWGKNGRITGLEIYDLDPKASHHFPELANLRTWEQFGTA